MVAASMRHIPITIDRLPKHLQARMRAALEVPKPSGAYLEPNAVYEGDAREVLCKIEPNSVALSVWSPPYFVGKNYEAGVSFDGWQALLKDVIALHFPIIKPGGFVAINIADILCFRDPQMPKIQAEVFGQRKSVVTRDDVLRAITEHPEMNRYQIAKLLKCSEQTVDRRLHGNNIRGGKYDDQTRVKIVGGLIEQWALQSGFYTHDRRIWVKDAAWENSRWASLSYRSVDEFEYLYVFWKPGVTKVDRSRLSKSEWRNWGSRAVWNIPSVRANNDHEAKFPLELPSRTIRLLTDPGETVLDCFLGSGTTAVAAINAGRNFIGIEREKKYAALSRKKVSEALRSEMTLAFPETESQSTKHFKIDEVAS